MKKIILTLLSLLTISDFVMSQNRMSSFTFKGVLIDSLTRISEPYATIKITKKEYPTKPIKMLVTNMKGEFEGELPSVGDFILTITSVGRKPIIKNFSITSDIKFIDLGILYISDASNELGQVEILAKKQLVKVYPDKIEYNIEDDPDSKTNTVIDMLRKVPLVTVDGEDNIQVNGSSNFKVYINGKLNNMMSNNSKVVFRSMPTYTIKYIEVMTSPGAKYDAEGLGGILNIVTMKNKLDGYTASLNGLINNRGLGGGLYVLTKYDKFTLSGNFNFNNKKQPTHFSEIFREDYKSDDLKFLYSQGETSTKDKFRQGNLEVSFEIDTLRLLSMSLEFDGSSNHNDLNNATEMWNDKRDKKAYSFRNIDKSNDSWHSVLANIDYQRISLKNKNRILTLSYKISDESENDNTYKYFMDLFQVPSSFQLCNFHTIGKSRTMEHTFQVDYVTPIRKSHNLESGIKYIIRNNISKNNFSEDDKDDGKDIYLYNEKRSSNYRHLNGILAAYLSHNMSLNRLSIKSGIRFERTTQDVKYLVGAGEDFITSYSNFIPSVSFGIQLDELKTLSGGYNMRIYRPGIWYLNPYYDNRNPLLIKQGNSNLESERNNVLNLSYSQFTSNLNFNLSLSHSFNHNGLEEVNSLIQKGGKYFGVNNEHFAPEGAIYTTYENIGKSNSTDMNLYLNCNLSSSTRTFINSRINYSDFTSPSQKAHNSGWRFLISGGIQHTFKSKIQTSLNFGGGTPYISLQGKGNHFLYYDLKVNHSFFQNRLLLSIYGSNIFSRYKYSNDIIMGRDFYYSSKVHYNNCSFGINVTYRIGELKSNVKKANRTIINDDLRGSTSS